MINQSFNILFAKKDKPHNLQNANTNTLPVHTS